MSMRHDFNDGKYTIINDNGQLTALRNGEPWGRDLTGDNLIYWMLVEVIRLKTLSVTDIMLAVVPGVDGMGQEVYATSVADVVDKLTELGQVVEEVTAQRERWDKERTTYRSLLMQARLVLRGPHTEQNIVVRELVARIEALGVHFSA